MTKKNILVVSNPGTMSEELFAWINSTDTFHMTFAEADEIAIELSHQQLFDMVLIDATDPELNTKKLKAILPILNSEALLIGYTGETFVQLDDKVQQAFDRRKVERMKKLLILDSSINNRMNLPPFSLN